MVYCKDKKRAIVTYKFPEKPQERYISDNPPIDVSVSSEMQDVSASYDFTFDGTVEGRTYSFGCVAPSGVPSNAEIYLTSGSWDDWGTVGSYSTGYGIVKSFSGAVLVGIGTSVGGTVVNERVTNCYARLVLQFRWGEGYRLKILKDGATIHQELGKYQPSFNVACDEDCPPGYCKCITTKYPGYCCISCKEIAQKINSLAARIK